MKTSGFSGVCFQKSLHLLKRWRAVIRVNGKQLHLGYFNSEVEAAKAYNAAIVKFGLNCPLNEFPEDEARAKRELMGEVS